MAKDYLTTIEVARAAGVHPNTVRLYEQWGFLPPIQRTPKGYRKFTQAHIVQMRLAVAALHAQYAGQNIRQAAVTAVRQAALGNLAQARESAETYLSTVHSEQDQAERAAGLLERWAQGKFREVITESMQIKQAAAYLHSSVDMLRNWERNGLIRVPRDPATGFRVYGSAEIGRLRVIRMLVRAGYSLMAILRMLTAFEKGTTGDLRHVLDTPRPDEDVYGAADRWLSALAEQEQVALKMLSLIDEMIDSQSKLTLQDSR